MLSYKEASAGTVSASWNGIFPSAPGKTWRRVRVAARRDGFRLRKVGIADSWSGNPFRRRCRRRSSGRASRHFGRRQLGACGSDERHRPDEGASDPGEKRLPDLRRHWPHFWMNLTPRTPCGVATEELAVEALVACRIARDASWVVVFAFR
jgi:hypothetical protein